MRGIDHVGITAPDIEGATAFFVDVPGCRLLYTRGSQDDRDASLQNQLGVPLAAASRRSARYAAPTARTSSCSSSSRPTNAPIYPRPGDHAIQHLALYVDDLDDAVEHLGRHDDARLLSGPEAGPGNRFIYARTPWGMTIELISYPAPMDYQRYTSARRWMPPPGGRPRRRAVRLVNPS